MTATRNAAVLAATLVLGLPIVAPQLAAAQAPCVQWKFSSPFWAIQGSYRVYFQLKQSSATTLEGYSQYDSLPEFRNYGGGMSLPAYPERYSGPVTGLIKGDHLAVSTSWGGVYIGDIDANGRIAGYTYDKRNRGSHATWHSDRSMPCLVRAGAQPQSAPRPSMQPIIVPMATPSVLSSARGSKSASLFR